MRTCKARSASYFETAPQKICLSIRLNLFVATGLLLFFMAPEVDSSFRNSLSEMVASPARARARCLRTLKLEEGPATRPDHRQTHHQYSPSCPQPTAPAGLNTFMSKYFHVSRLRDDRPAGVRSSRRHPMVPQADPPS